MSHDEFTKLFQYMEKRFAAIDKRFNGIDERFDRVEGTLADIQGDPYDIKLETTLLKRTDDKHERWIRQFARKTDSKLKPEP